MPRAAAAEIATDPDARRPTRAERREQSQEQILETAIAQFAERGYDGVSLDDIAAAAGVKRALILYYFRNKDELWRAAAEIVCRRFDGRVEARLARNRGRDESERLRSVVEGWLDAFLEEPNLAKLLVREGGQAGPRLDWLVQHFNYSPVPFGSEAVKRSLRGTIMRDALMAIYLAMAALGPLMEASLGRVSGKPKAGVHPLSKKNRRELVDLIMRFIGAAEDRA